MERLDGCVCIFDLDGTLVDSAPDLIGALNRLLVREGLAPMTTSTVRPIVGEGARAMIRKAFDAQGKLPSLEGREDTLVAEYIDDYVEHICEESYVFEGVAQARDELATHGAALAVCTNKTERLAEPLLKAVGLWDRFEMVVASDTLAEKKPSALPLMHIKEKLGQNRAVMVGDTFTDQAAADAAELPAFVASFGYGQTDPRLAQAVKFDHFRDLPRMIIEAASAT